MRAAVCREYGAPMTIEEVTIAAPAADEVLVDVAAVAICHSDVAYLDGAWGGQLPAIHGHEASGTVAAVGSDVSGVAPGDTVAITLVRSCGVCTYCEAGDRHLCFEGYRADRDPVLHSATGEPIVQAMSTAAFAEQVLVHESQVAAVPAGVAPAPAALLACGVVTGFGAVTNTAGVPAGASVAVVGTGGVGINAIQGAVHVGADPIIAIDLRDDKLAVASRAGATATINSANTKARRAVAELTDGRGADFVFVAVGSSAAIESSLPLLRRGGTLVIVGLPATADPITVDSTMLAVQGQRILGSRMGSVSVATDVPMLADLYLGGRLMLDELITNTYPFEEINTAVDSARAGGAVRNVVLIAR